MEVVRGPRPNRPTRSHAMSVSQPHNLPRFVRNGGRSDSAARAAGGAGGLATGGARTQPDAEGAPPL